MCALRLDDGGFHRREHRTGGTVARGEGGLIGDGVRREAKTGKARRSQSERGLRGCRCQATKHTPTPKGRKPPGDTSSSDTVGAESYRTLERSALLTLPTSLDFNADRQTTLDSIKINFISRRDIKFDILIMAFSSRTHLTQKSHSISLNNRKPRDYIQLNTERQISCSIYTSHVFHDKNYPRVSLK